MCFQCEKYENDDNILFWDIPCQDVKKGTIESFADFFSGC